MKRFTIILFFLMLTACTLPAAGTVPPIVTATIVLAPTPTTSNAECAYVEGRKDSPKLSTSIAEKLKALGLSVEKTRAEAYGENCIAADNSIVRFAQREIDFYITLNVLSLKDETSLGNQLEQILTVIEQFPSDQVGPNPGYVGVTFQSGSQVKNLWFTLQDANALQKQDIKGADLYKALVKKP